jgi:hypothetical protein
MIKHKQEARMKGKHIKGKNMKKFFGDYVKLDVTPLNMTFGVLYESCVVVLGKRRLEILKIESDSGKREARVKEMLDVTEEILWEIMKELEQKDTRANRFLFRIKLMEDARKYSEKL